MSRVCVKAFLLIVALMLTNSTSAAVVTIEGTVKSVDAKKRTIRVKTKSQTLELDVSRKAKVSVNGKVSKLDSLKTGQKAKLTFHDELEIVLKIEASGNKPKSTTELVEIAELLTGANASFPWVSTDGLTIYWESWHPEGAFISTAHRDDAESVFKNKQRLFKGRHPTVTADGTEMILLVEGVLHSARRESIDKPFKRPKLIRELQDEPKVKNPSLSADGLKLYFNRSVQNRESEFVVTTRQSTDSPWAKPDPVPINWQESEGILTWLSVSSDERMLLCCHEATHRVPDGQANLMVWTRDTLDEPFVNHRYIEIPGMDALVGRSPRYVPATSELFFTRLMGEDQSGKRQWKIWSVKNFTPQAIGIDPSK